ncbi:MAG: hypothetical protein ABIQ10_05920 [Gemmatimonadaceae bacterium]
MSATTVTLPAWLPGLWTREWIERRGVRSDAFDVHYFQTPTVFGDMRIPRDRPLFPNATSFADLTDAELLSLAKQRGFAGYTTVAGALATWHHEVDFQPPDTSADIGRIERVDDAHMLEHATDSSYTESWRTIDVGERRFLVIRVESGSRLDRLLLVAGDRFLFVRNRTRDLPPPESIDALIVATRATRAQLIEYLDCEFSTGLVRGGAGPWRIKQSTLPWRQNKRLAFADDIAIAGGTPAPRLPSIEHWAVPVNTFSQGDLLSLFPSR